MTGDIGVEVDQVFEARPSRGSMYIPVDLIPLLSAHFASHRDRLLECGDTWRAARAERVLDELAKAFTVGVARSDTGDAATDEP